MSRVQGTSSVESLESEIETLKKKIDNKEDRSVLGLSVKGTILLGIMLLVAGYVLYVIAATGLRTIPVFSKLVYRVPAPIRVVIPVNPSIDNIQKEFEKKISSQIANGTVGDVVLNARYTEGELTGLIWKGLSSSQQSSSFSKAQVVILPEKMELYAVYAGDRPLYLTAEVVPSIQEGVASIDVQSIHVGSYEVPRFIGNKIIGSLIESSLNKLIDVAQSQAEVQGITLKDGIVDISLRIKKQ